MMTENQKLDWDIDTKIRLDEEKIKGRLSLENNKV